MHSQNDAEAFNRMDDYSSKKSFSCLLRLGCLSLRRALASIWRIRSLVTPNTLPTSSSVRVRHHRAQIANATRFLLGLSACQEHLQVALLIARRLHDQTAKRLPGLR